MDIEKKVLYRSVNIFIQQQSKKYYFFSLRNTHIKGKKKLHSHY